MGYNFIALHCHQNDHDRFPPSPHDVASRFIIIHPASSSAWELDLLSKVKEGLNIVQYLSVPLFCLISQMSEINFS